MAFSHGSNDAQKSMGVITLALIGAGIVPADSTVPRWVVLSCAVAIAAGTYAGGTRIIETVGEKICPLDPVSGFAGSAASALTILAGSVLGLPLSTTHVVIGGVTGAGYGRSRQINWLTWRNMGLAWLITLPASAMISGLAFAILQWLSLNTN
jgi:Phosphate/sulphate permeases